MFLRYFSKLLSRVLRRVRAVWMRRPDVRLYNVFVAHRPNYTPVSHPMRGIQIIICTVAYRN